MSNKKTIIITGSNSGIGFEAAKILCETPDKYEVILACRSEERGQAAVNAIKKKSPSADVVYMNLDVSSFASVRKFVDDFHASGRKLHVLCNNAGLVMPDTGNVPQYTKDGFECTIATNHLGHFLLTSLLLQDLKNTAQTDEARIVNTASQIHDAVKAKRMKVRLTDFDDLMYKTPGSYNSFQAYKDSKLANVMFTRELAKRLSGTNITVSCFCPGMVPGTNFFKNASCFMRCCVTCMSCCLHVCGVSRTPHQGGDAMVQLATSDILKGVTGKYFVDQQEVVPAEEALDDDACVKLWNLTEGMIGEKMGV